ncbi:hypothetical protein [Shewanella algae]|uniref:hypothetical protein n=1 Tax=Shewanella algae TaxID=38313 RepID=UPI001183347F|nr:hypothetical protein [Shewanella algae]TVL14793.1 hypothetical protein AYJ02_12065 [Shewanella algae]HEW9976689.1 hypothetical protein [Shewanella algae]
MARGKPQTNNRSRKKSEAHKVTVAEAFRDVVIKAIDRGQLLPLIGGFCLVLLIWKMPEDKAYEFATNMAKGFQDLSLFGWLLAVFFAVSWSVHVRSIRRKHSEEYRRIGREKSELQGKRAKIKLESSDNS